MVIFPICSVGDKRPREPIMTPFVEEINLDDIALAAMQGRLAAGAKPQIAAVEAWAECVDAYMDARDTYLLKNPNVEIHKEEENEEDVIFPVHETDETIHQPLIIPSLEHDVSEK